jgi:outer membrane lipoprotein-sorting protein
MPVVQSPKCVVRKRPVVKTMAGTKVRLAVGISFAALLLATYSKEAAAQTKVGDQLTAAQVFQKSQDAYAALTSYSDEGRVGGVRDAKVSVVTFTTKLSRPGLYRIDWAVGIFRGTVWSPGTGNFLKLNDGGEPREFPGPQQALAAANPLSLGLSVHVPGMFFNLLWDDEPWPSGKSVERKPDETIAGVDCYVLTQAAAASTATFWIAKKDLFFRQIERQVDGAKTKAAIEAKEKEHPETVPSDIPGRADMPKGSVTVETHFNIAVNQPIPQTDFEP